MKRYFAVIGLLFSLKSFSQSIEISKGWQMNIGDSSEWAATSYNDSHWKTINNISPFERNGFPDFQNFGWMRKKVVLTSGMKAAADKAGYFYLSLGKIYDADQVYFNGNLAGQSGGIPPAENIVVRDRRIYKIAAKDILWNKENLIAVRVFANFHNGGLQGEACNIIIPSENIFHVTGKVIPSFPLPRGQQAYEALVDVALPNKEKILKERGGIVKLKLPKGASVFYNDKFIGAINFSGEQSLFIPACFISWEKPDKITVYLNSKDALENILFSTPIISALQGNNFNLMQVANLKVKKGSFKDDSPVTLIVQVINSTTTDFDGRLTLALATDINNMQQSSSQLLHLNRLQEKEVEFTLTPNFSGVYQVNYILQNEAGEKITGTLAKGER
jgi:hypothetical protein